MRLPAMAAVMGLLLALCGSARAQSSGAQDDEAASRARALQARPADSLGAAEGEERPAEPQEVAPEEGAQTAVPGGVAPQDGHTGEPGDTLVVPPRGPDQPGYTMIGENVIYDDPTFVPYKLRAAARLARARADLASIP